MPYINLKTNVEIKDKEYIKRKLGEIITIIPNKSASRTMICLEDKKDIYFGEDDVPCALVETLVNKGTDHTFDKDYCDAVLMMISKELNISEFKIYSLLDEEDLWHCHK